MKDMVTLKHMREQIELVIKAKDKELTSLHKKVKDLEEENGGLRAFAEIHGVTKGEKQQVEDVTHNTGKVNKDG